MKVYKVIYKKFEHSNDFGALISNYSKYSISEQEKMFASKESAQAFLDKRNEAVQLLGQLELLSSIINEHELE